MAGHTHGPSWDTGATENAIGLDSLNDLVHSGQFVYQVSRDDLPVFRFGNGHRDRALSKVSLQGTSLGDISFYVLGGMATRTPPLIGARTLRQKEAMVSYSSGEFSYKNEDGTMKNVQMQALRSGHVTINLAEGEVGSGSVNWAAFESDLLETPQVLMVQLDTSLPDRLQLLAQRLQALRDRSTDVQSSSSMRRPSSLQLPLQGQPQGGQSPLEPACHLDNMCELTGFVSSTPARRT